MKKEILSVATVNRWTQKTIAYLKSKKGRKNWKINHEERGYEFRENLFEAIQTATRLIKYESLNAVYARVLQEWAPARGWVV
jgi:hypothetical protein